MVQAALSMLGGQTAVPSLLGGGGLSTSAQQQLLMALAQGQVSSPSALHAALGVPSSRPLALAPDYQVRHVWCAASALPPSVSCCRCACAMDWLDCSMSSLQ